METIKKLNQVEVKTYWGKSYKIEYSEDETVEELKVKFLSLDSTLEDCDLIYKGKKLTDTTLSIESVLKSKEDISAFFIMSKGVGSCNGGGGNGGNCG